MKRKSLLLQELRQSRPFPSLAEEATVSLARTHDLLERRLALLLQPHGITPQQYNVLRILRGAGEEGLPTLEIGARMVSRVPGITRLLDRLEAKGLVRRERCETDRRQVLCWATPSAMELVGALDAPVTRSTTDALADLDDEDQLALLELLERIRRRAAEKNRESDEHLPTKERTDHEP